MHVVDRDFGRRVRNLRDILRQRARAERHVGRRRDHSQQISERQDDGSRGQKAQCANSPPPHRIHDDDEERRRKSRSHQQRAQRRTEPLLHDGIRREQRRRHRETHERGVSGEHSEIDLVLASTQVLEVIRDKDRPRRDGWQDVAREFRLGKGEKQDRHRCPENQESSQSQPAKVCQRVALTTCVYSQSRAQDNPSQEPRDESRNRQYRPRQQASEQDRNVKPYRLRVVIEIRPEAREILPQDELREELRVAHLHKHVPGQRRR